MALRLSDFILAGELINLKRNSTHGYVVIRGEETPVMFELTGDATPGFTERHIRFEVRNPVTEGPGIKGLRLARHQIGPTGSMEYRLAKFPRGENAMESLDQQGTPVEFDSKPLLYLEWYSQNGRVVIELIDPKIEVVEGDPLSEPVFKAPGGTSPLAATSIRLSDREKEPRIEHLEIRPHEEEKAAEEGGARGNIDDYLEQQNQKIERRIHGKEVDEDSEDVMRELELMDYLIEHEPGEPAGSLLHPQQLPAPGDIGEEQALTLVKSLLMELALYGVAIHICEHFTMKRAYEYLLAEVLPEMRVHPELKGTGWVQNFMTHDSCEDCKRESEEDTRRRELGEGGS